MNKHNNNRKLNYKHLIIYGIRAYNSLQNLQKPFSVEIYRNINLSCPSLLRSMHPSVRPSVRPSVCLSVCLSHAPRSKRCISGAFQGYDYYSTLIRSPVLEVKLAGPSGRSRGVAVRPTEVASTSAGHIVSWPSGRFLVMPRSPAVYR